MIDIQFVCTYVMPVTVGLMFTGVIVGLQVLSNED